MSEYRNRPPLTITIPRSIHKRDTPNGRYKRNHMAHNRVVGNARRAGRDAAMEVVNPNDPYQCFQTSRWPLTIHIMVGWEPRRQMMDDDNVKASMKSYLDGIADVLGIDDRNFIIGTVGQQRDPDKRGFIKIAIEATEEDE